MIRSPRMLAVVATFAVAGCYVSQPVTGGVAPQAGARVELEINDAGRVGLGTLVGPEIERIEGTMLEKDTAGMTIAVKHVYGFRGSVQVWSDEQVRIQDSYVSRVSLRRFSTGRSVALGAAGVAGATIFVTSGLGAFFFGGDEIPTPPTDTSGQKIIRLIKP